MRASTTNGTFKTEPEACDAFDKAITMTGWFWVEKEVTGRILTNTKMIDRDGVRIDRLLIPNHKIQQEHGWKHGPIGVEIKKSDTKIGTCLNQVLDYKNSVFISQRLQHAIIIPKLIFLFPLTKQTGEMASLMAQQWFGNMFFSERGRDRFLEAFIGEIPFFRIGINTPYVEVCKTLPGQKYGSR